MSISETSISEVGISEGGSEFGPVTVQVPAVSVAVSKNDPDLRTGASAVLVSTKSISVSLNTPSIRTGVSVRPDEVDVSVSANIPTIQQILNLDENSIVVSINPPGVVAGASVFPNSRSVSVTCNQPSVVTGSAIQPPNVSVTVSLNTPIVSAGVRIDAESTLQIDYESGAISDDGISEIDISGSTLRSFTYKVIPSVRVRCSSPQVVAGASVLPDTIQIDVSPMPPEISSRLKKPRGQFISF